MIDNNIGVMIDAGLQLIGSIFNFFKWPAETPELEATFDQLAISSFFCTNFTQFTYFLYNTNNTLIRLTLFMIRLENG